MPWGLLPQFEPILTTGSHSSGSLAAPGLAEIRLFPRNAWILLGLITTGPGQRFVPENPGQGCPRRLCSRDLAHHVQGVLVVAIGPAPMTFRVRYLLVLLVLLCAWLDNLRAGVDLFRTQPLVEGSALVVTADEPDDLRNPPAATFGSPVPVPDPALSPRLQDRSCQAMGGTAAAAPVFVPLRR
jgi:hypothetical protein